MKRNSPGARELAYHAKCRRRQGANDHAERKIETSTTETTRSHNTSNTS